MKKQQQQYHLNNTNNTNNVSNSSPTTSIHSIHLQQLKQQQQNPNQSSGTSTVAPPPIPPILLVEDAAPSGHSNNTKSKQPQPTTNNAPRGLATPPSALVRFDAVPTTMPSARSQRSFRGEDYEGGDGVCSQSVSVSTPALDGYEFSGGALGSADEMDSPTSPVFKIITEGITKQLNGQSSGSAPGGMKINFALLNNNNDDSDGESYIYSLAKQQLGDVYRQLQDHSRQGVLLIDIKDAKKKTIIFANDAAKRTLGRLDLVGGPLSEIISEEAGSAIRWPRYSSLPTDRTVGFDRKSDGTSGGPSPGGFKRRRPRSDAASDVSSLNNMHQFDDLLLNSSDSVQEHIIRVKRRGDEGCTETFEARVFVSGVRLGFEPETATPRIFAVGLRNDAEALRVSTLVKVMKSALSSVSEGIVIADLEGKIEWMNEAAEKLSGHALSTVLEHNQTVSLFVANDFRERHESYLRYFAANHVASMRSTEGNGRTSCQEMQQELLTRTDMMNTSFGPKEVKLRVEVLYGQKLIGYIKSTRDFIPRKHLEKERLKLLLPTPIVQKVLADPSVPLTDWTWDFSNMTVIFTDVKGFSTWSREQPVKVVHDRMQPMFQEFERIVQAFGGELIHRIGDAVMALFGLSGHGSDHARLAVACATEMQLWASEHNIQVRLGAASGSVKGAIKGSFEYRPSFEIWGETVDRAKALEASGRHDHLHLDDSTVVALGRRFQHILDKVLTDSSSPSSSRPLASPLKRFKEAAAATTTSPRNPNSPPHSGRDGQQQRAFFVQCAGKAFVPGKGQQPNGESVRLPDDYLQLVKFQQSEFAKWKKKEEEKAQRLAELGKI